MPKYRIDEIKLSLSEDEDCLAKKVKKKLGPAGRNVGVSNLSIIKKSIDGRKGEVRFVYSLSFDADKRLKLPEYKDAECVIPKADMGIAKDIDCVTHKAVKGMAEDIERVTHKAVKGKAKDIDRVAPKAMKGIAKDTEHIIPNAKKESANSDGEMRPIVVGFGPAGMFAALVLAGAGLRPLVLERGGDVDTRSEKVAHFWKTGELDPECNVQFGEGGAGTFSDGKLNTGIKDSRIRFVLKTFVEAGASPDILIDARPHIGTDILKTAVKSIRERIIRLGGEVRFNTRVDKVLVSNEGDEGARTAPGVTAPGVTALGVRLSSGEKIRGSHIILALGHSARDTVRSLYDQGISMEAKAFSMGVRVEHPQELIDKGLYGEAAGNPKLPPAYYKLSYRAKDGRGVYSFCMCPGGEIVNASSQFGGVVTNGMSGSKRDSGYANSGILVDVRPEDYGGPASGAESMTASGAESSAASVTESGTASGAESSAVESVTESRTASVTESMTASRVESGAESRIASGAALNAEGRAPVAVNPLKGMAFQEHFEYLAFVNGGKDYSLPETTWEDFRNGAECKKERNTGNAVVDSLPRFVAKDIAEAMPFFGKRIPGFDGDETRIVGIESRSSSPVRIIRDAKSLVAAISGEPVKGLYPAGEGAGYAGGITSAAVDGIKIAERIIEELLLKAKNSDA